MQNIIKYKTHKYNEEYKECPYCKGKGVICIC